MNRDRVINIDTPAPNRTVAPRVGLFSLDRNWGGYEVDVGSQERYHRGSHGSMERMALSFSEGVEN